MPDNFDQRSQEGLRQSSLIAFNTHASPKQAHKTDSPDHQLKEYLFELVFPLFQS